MDDYVFFCVVCSSVDKNIFRTLEGGYITPTLWLRYWRIYTIYY